MEWEYNTKEEADTMALSLKHLIGTTIKHKIKEEDCIVKDVFTFPIALRNNGEDIIKGYDVKIAFKDKPFTTWSKALEVAFQLNPK